MSLGMLRSVFVPGNSSLYSDMIMALLRSTTPGSTRRWYSHLVLVKPMAASSDVTTASAASRFLRLSSGSGVSFLPATSASESAAVLPASVSEESIDAI